MHVIAKPSLSLLIFFFVFECSFAKITRIEIISTEVYAVVVFMAVATTLFSPLLLKIAFRGPPALEPDKLGNLA